MPRKRMPYTEMFKNSTKSLKLLYPTLALSKKLNPNAKSFTPKKLRTNLDIRRVTNLLNPGVKGLNPLAKSFYPKKSRGKKHKMKKTTKSKSKSQKRKRRVSRRR